MKGLGKKRRGCVRNGENRENVTVATKLGTGTAGWDAIRKET